MKDEITNPLDAPPAHINLDRAPDGRYVIRLNNTALAKGGNCLRYLLYKTLFGLSRAGFGGGESNYKADYGSGFHRAAQVWYGGRAGGRTDMVALAGEARQAAMDFYAPVPVPDDDWRTGGHLSATWAGYLKHWGESDGLVAGMRVEKDRKYIEPGMGVSVLTIDKPVPTLEHTFEVVIYEDALVVVYICGTIDFVGTFARQRVIADHKVTARFAGDDQRRRWLTWFEQSPQLLLYRKAWELETGERALGVMVNGVFITPTGKNGYLRSQIYYFSQARVDRHWEWIKARAMEVVNHFRTLLNGGEPADWTNSDRFPTNNTVCEGGWSLCEFSPLCLAANREDWAWRVESEYVRRVYRPAEQQRRVVVEE